MGTNYIALAIPLFFVFIAIEIGVARRRGADVYRFSDSFGDVGCGLAQQIITIFLVVLKVAGYAYVYEHFRIYEFPSAALAWVFAFIAVDFIYYWWHRLSHRVNFLWAAHVVHHQSEEYNLSVALRQSVLTNFTTWPFYALVAVLGVPPLVLATTIAFSTLYQFWIHTRLIGTLGPFEWVFNTPSHHRGHHARNPRYIDRNYGATLIIWDRLFGTFAKETEEPIYGITKPLRSFDPMWAQVAPWVDMGRAMRAAPRFIDKVRTIVMPPAWVPGPDGGHELEAREVPEDQRARVEGKAERSVQVYVAAHTTLVIVGGTFVMLYESAFPRVTVAASSALILFALASFGALLDVRRWGVALEIARLAVTVTLAIAWSLRSLSTPNAALAITIAIIIGALSALALVRARSAVVRSLETA